MRLTFHFDPTCPWTWITSRWLLLAADEVDLDVEWAPFSLVHANRDKEVPARFLPLRATSVAATRVVQHLVAAGDQDGVRRFYDTWGDRYHRGGKDASVELVVDAVEAAGLDAAAAAAHDESIDAAVGRATDLAYDAAGPDIGSPVLHWVDDGDQDVWIFGPLFGRVPEARCAGELWQGVRNLAVHGMFKELKRGRQAPPDVSSS